MDHVALSSHCASPPRPGTRNPVERTWNYANRLRPPRARTPLTDPAPARDRRAPRAVETEFGRDDVNRARIVRDGVSSTRPRRFSLRLPDVSPIPGLVDAPVQVLAGVVRVIAATSRSSTRPCGSSSRRRCALHRSRRFCGRGSADRVRPGPQAPAGSARSSGDPRDRSPGRRSRGSRHALTARAAHPVGRCGRGARRDPGSRPGPARDALTGVRGRCAPGPPTSARKTDADEFTDAGAIFLHGCGDETSALTTRARFTSSRPPPLPRPVPRRLSGRRGQIPGRPGPARAGVSRSWLA